MRTAGLEPARLTALPPQSSASANSATCACCSEVSLPGRSQPFRIVAKMVGAVRFELTTSCTRNKRATRLRYAPYQMRRGSCVMGVHVATDFCQKMIPSMDLGRFPAFSKQHSGNNRETASRQSPFPASLWPPNRSAPSCDLDTPVPGSRRKPRFRNHRAVDCMVSLRQFSPVLP